MRWTRAEQWIVPARMRSRIVPIEAPSPRRARVEAGRDDADEDEAGAEDGMAGAAGGCARRGSIAALGPSRKPSREKIRAPRELCDRLLCAARVLNSTPQREAVERPRARDAGAVFPREPSRSVAALGALG